MDILEPDQPSAEHELARLMTAYLPYIQKRVSGYKAPGLDADFYKIYKHLSLLKKLMGFQDGFYSGKLCRTSIFPAVNAAGEKAKID